MKILVTPEDIIKRCLWSKYKKFVLRQTPKDEIVNIIKNNDIISLSENDAYVIGLLKVIETDNLVHRFRLEIEEFVKIKTTVNKDRVIINKSALLKEVLEFKDRFPDAYDNERFNISKKELYEFITDVHDQINELETVEINFKEKNYTFIYSKDVNKILKFKV